MIMIVLSGTIKSIKTGPLPLLRSLLLLRLPMVMKKIFAFVQLDTYQSHRTVYLSHSSSRSLVIYSHNSAALLKKHSRPVPSLNSVVATMEREKERAKEIIWVPGELDVALRNRELPNDRPTTAVAAPPKLMIRPRARHNNRTCSGARERPS